MPNANITNIQLSTAIAESNLELVENLLKGGASITGRNAQGKTPIQQAAYANNWPMVQCILKHGTGNDSQDNAEFGYALMRAAANRQEELALALLDKGANPENWHSGGDRTIHFAIQNNLVRLLSKLVVTPENRETKNKFGLTPLELAIQRNNKDAVEILLKAGASITGKNARGETPIRQAAAANNWLMVQCILEHGTGNDSQDNAEFGYALMRAAANGQEELALALLDKGANPENSHSGGDSTIHFAIQNNLVSLLSELVLTPENRETKNKFGLTPLELAIHCNNITAVEILLKAGASITSKNAQGETPIEQAAKAKHWSIAECIAKRITGSDLNQEVNTETGIADEKPGLIHEYKELATLFNDKFIALENEIFLLLQKNMPADSKANQILKFIQDALTAAKQKDLNAYDTLDLYVCVKNLLNILSPEDNAKTDDALGQDIKEFFKQRENEILNTSRDYSYSDSPTNQLCKDVANLYTTDEEKRAYDLLLHQAKTEDRGANPWFNYSDGTGCLPLHRGEFFRSGDNSIHLYQQIVMQAIANLNDHQRDLSKIWYRSDAKGAKNIDTGQAGKPLPLDLQDLLILKQRTPSLAKLVDYTIKIDQANKNGEFNTAYDIFVDLRNGLQAGSVSNKKGTATEGEAGPEAAAAIVKFVVWWDTQPQTLKDEICALTIPHRRNEHIPLGDLIDSIIGDDNCVDVKQKFLTLFLDDERVQNTLKKKESGVLLDNDTLKQWQTQIEQELNDLDHVPSISINRFEAEPKFYQYLLLTEQQEPVPLDDKKLKELKSTFEVKYKNTDEYEQFVDLLVNFLDYKKQDRDADFTILTQYVQSQKNNKVLDLLIDELNQPKYDYLRKKDSVFSYHYGLFYNSDKKMQTRTQTNQAYADFERVLSKQLLSNVTTEDDKQKLMEQYSFIKNKRSGYFGIGCSKTGRL